MRVALLRAAFIPIVFLFFFISPSWPDDSVLDFLTEVPGYCFLMVGLGLRIWSALYIGQRKSKQLVTDGPYSLCRNPLYLGTFAIAFGAGLVLSNPLMSAFTVLVFIPVHMWVAMAEERHLKDVFGQSYEEYRRSVPAFLPSLRNYRSREEIPVSARAMWRVALEASLVLLIPPAGELLELLHTSGLVPVLWRFP
jgi:protein-S-isoprenylcysteine O-methyltransferase Ste14